MRGTAELPHCSDKVLSRNLHVTLNELFVHGNLQETISGQAAVVS